MTTSSLPRTALFALALSMAGATVTFAQTSAPADTATGKDHHHHDANLSADEKAQLKAAEKSALAADPSLGTEKANLKQKKETLKAGGANVAETDRKAFHQEKHQYKAKLRAAELKANPNLAPIFAKLDAGKPHHGHHSAT